MGRSAFAVAVAVAHSDALGLSLLAPSLSAGIIDVHGAVAGDVLCRTWAQLAAAHGLPLTRAALGAAGADLTMPVYTHTHCTWVCVCVRVCECALCCLHHRRPISLCLSLPLSVVLSLSVSHVASLPGGSPLRCPNWESESLLWKIPATPPPPTPADLSPFPAPPQPTPHYPCVALPITPPSPRSAPKGGGGGSCHGWSDMLAWAAKKSQTGIVYSTPACS